MQQEQEKKRVRLVALREIFRNAGKSRHRGKAVGFFLLLSSPRYKGRCGSRAPAALCYIRVVRGWDSCSQTDGPLCVCCVCVVTERDTEGPRQRELIPQMAEAAAGAIPGFVP